MKVQDTAPLWFERSDVPLRPEELPLLFVHGDFATGRISWSRQWSALAPSRSIAIMDRRGSGQSPKDPVPYTIHRDAVDVIEVAAAAFGEVPVGIVGHSYGAIVSLEAACQAPERIAHLFLIEPPYLSLLPDDPVVGELARHTEALRARAQHLKAEDLTFRFFSNVIGEDNTRRLAERSVWPALVAEADRFANEEFVGTYPAARLQELPGHVGISLFTGGKSHPALQRIAFELHRRLPASRLHTFADAGHDVQRIGPPFDAVLMAGPTASG